MKIAEDNKVKEVKRAVMLQLDINRQIIENGEASENDVNELMSLVDGFDEGEESDFLNLYFIEEGIY